MSLLLGLCCGSAAQGAARSPKITFFLGLTRPEASAERAFFAVEQPGSPSYRRFLTVTQVARRYGASRATRTAFLRAATRYGLRARIDPSGVFARVSAPVTRFDRVFKVRIHSLFTQDPNRNIYFLKGNARLHLPADMRRLVEDVVPSYSHSANSPGHSNDEQAHAARPEPPRRTGTWTRGCAKAKKTGAYSFGQVRTAYGVSQLGSGRTASVAILNVGEGALPRDIAANARCFGYPKLRARTLLSDGQTRRFGPQSFEPDEDLALVRGIAPGLTSLTFSQAWLSAELWFLGAAQVLDAPRLPDSFTISYGECERTIRGKFSTPTTRAGANLMDAMFVRLGLAGVGSYASSGDFGSTCDGRPFSGVTWPGSSPFVTCVGGTRLTLNRANQRTGEVVWNDLRWLSPSQGGGAGGGGFSVASRRPPFQAGLGLPGGFRTTPDVSAAASNLPGWPVELGGNWAVDGGTSASTPLVATAMAIISAQQRRHHRPPIGPANGLFYYLAKHSPKTMWDVVSGSNGYLRKVPARHARRGYDLASGLGVPQFARVSAALPAPAR